MRTAAGSCSVTVTAAVARADVLLWWPHDLSPSPGPPALYNLTTHLLLPSAHSRSQLQIGFRTFEIVRAPQEGAAESFHFKVSARAPAERRGLILLSSSSRAHTRAQVNGQPTRAKGANVVPPSLLHAHDAQRSERLVELAAAGGMNMLRVWGGALPAARVLRGL